MVTFHKERNVIQGFYNAFAGLSWAFKSQINFKIHTLALVLVVALGLIFKLNYYEWLILITVVTGVLTLELVNTSLEQTTDAITTEFNPVIKKAKDTAAAAVLIYAIYALVIGLLLFGTKLSNLL